MSHHSTTSYGIYTGECPISWKTKKQPLFLILSSNPNIESCHGLLWVDLSGFPHCKPTKRYCATTMQIQIVANLDFHGNNNLAQMPSSLWKIPEGYIGTTYIPTKHWRADVFTKALTKDKFHYFCSKLNLVVSPQFILRGNVRDDISSSCAHIAYNAEMSNVPVKGGTDCQVGLNNQEFVTTESLVNILVLL